MCQDPLHPPGRPEHVRIEAKFDTSLKLVWTPPRNTGGTKITGYIVDKKHSPRIVKEEKQEAEEGEKKEGEEGEKKEEEKKEEEEEEEFVKPRELSSVNSFTFEQ